MGDISAFNFWVNNPDFRLFKDEDPADTQWCEYALPLLEWGETLLNRLSSDPAPLKIGYAKWKVLDRYCRLYCRVTAEHRAETNLDNHPCIHQALLELWQQLEDMDLQAAIPELEPPQLPALAARQIPAVPEVEEITGILIGEAADDYDTATPARD